MNEYNIHPNAEKIQVMIKEMIGRMQEYKDSLETRFAIYNTDPSPEKKKEMMDIMCSLKPLGAGFSIKELTIEILNAGLDPMRFVRIILNVPEINHIEIIKILLNDSRMSRYDALKIAAEENNIEVVNQLLVDEHANLNIIVQVAAKEENAKIIKAVLDCPRADLECERLVALARGMTGHNESYNGQLFSQPKSRKWVPTIAPYLSNPPSSRMVR